VGEPRMFLVAALLLGVAVAAPLPSHVQLAGTQMLVHDQSGVLPPGEPEPDADGIVAAEIVNVKKTGVVLIQSSSTPEGAIKRQVIRDTWLQALNRSSDIAVPISIRRAYVVWFVVARESPEQDALIEAEGKKHGDVIFTKSNALDADDMDKFVSICRWLRVAYFERYDYGLFLQDDGYVNIQNLDDYLKTNGDPWFYGGSVKSFTKDTEGPNDYYAPYVGKGTMVISANFIETVSRDAMFIKHIGAEYDIGLGGFLQPFLKGPPVRIPGCVADLKTVYGPIENPIIVNGLSPELMAALAAGLPLPAQTTEIQTMKFTINPYPTTDREPLCDGMDDSGACKIAEKMLADPDFEPDETLHEKPPPNDFLRGYEKQKPYGPDPKEYPDPAVAHMLQTRIPDSD